MKAWRVAAAAVFALTACTVRAAADREKQWEKVREAEVRGLPRTAIDALRPIADQASSQRAWAEATAALVERLSLEAQVAGDPPTGKMTRLERALPAAPPAMRPILETILARWYREYLEANRWRLGRRSAVELPPAAGIETWNANRLRQEIALDYERALAARDAVGRTPIESFDA